MACHQLVQHVQASAAYLKSLPSSTQTYQVLENQCKAAKNLIAKIQGPVEALHVAQAVQEHWGGLLSDEQMNLLISLLNDAACKTPLQEMQLQQAGSRGHASQQHWESSFWKDIPKSLYDGLGDKRIQSTMRMADLFQYLASIGLRAPFREHSKGYVVAVLLRGFMPSWSRRYDAVHSSPACQDILEVIHP